MRCAMMKVVLSFINPFSASRISDSVSVSTEDVESSRIKMRGFFNSVRAIATRCFCPPERVTPFSPTIVLYPSGKVKMTSCTAAAFAARSTSSVGTSRSTPYMMFSRIERLNKKGSCSTIPICFRRYAREYSFNSTPSSRTLPPVYSWKRGRRFTREVLPEPVEPSSAIACPGLA